MIIVGGPALSRYFLEVLEDTVINKFYHYDDTIDRVEVIYFNLM